jgi:uncharacterized repeat protein (TIGR01451 family)
MEKLFYGSYERLLYAYYDHSTDTAEVFTPKLLAAGFRPNENWRLADLEKDTFTRYRTGERKVKGDIRRLYAEDDVCERVLPYFEEEIVKYIAKSRMADLLDAFIDLILSDSTLSLKQKERFRKLAETASPGVFLSELFIYAILQDPPPEKLYGKSSGKNKKIADEPDPKTEVPIIESVSNELISLAARLNKQYLAPGTNADKIDLDSIVIPAPTPKSQPVRAGWGPERETHTMNNPASKPIFNSIIDNPLLGDERSFVLVAEAGEYGVFSDEIQIVPGKEYEVLIRYSNNAAPDLNRTGVGIAQQVRLSTQFSSVVTPGRRGLVSAIISASNTEPREVWDGAYFTALQDTPLHYKDNSAKIYNDWKSNGKTLAESLFGSLGTYLGANDLDGRLPAGEKFSGHVKYTLVAERPEHRVNKMMSSDGKNFSQHIIAEPGQEIFYKAVFKNAGNADIRNVTFHDVLPPELTLVPGTTYLFSSKYPTGELLSDLIDKNGYNLGRYFPGATATLIYKVKIGEDALIDLMDGAKLNTKLITSTIYVDDELGEIAGRATITVKSPPER